VIHCILLNIKMITFSNEFERSIIKDISYRNHPLFAEQRGGRG
jgi:hypothetical protein